MEIQIKYSDGSIFKSNSEKSQPMDTDMRVPDVGEFYQVAHDWQLPEFQFKPRQFLTHTPNKAFPSTRMLWGCRARPYSDFVPVMYSWQWRLYELFRHVVGSVPEDGEPEAWWINDPLGAGKRIMVSKGTSGAFPQYPVGTLKNAYMDFILDGRFLTDAHAFNTIEETPAKGYRDDVLGLNINALNPWMMKSLTFTGNILNRVYPTESVPSDYFSIETFDYTKEAPSVDWILKNKSHLIWWTTEQAGMNGELPMTDGKRTWTVSRTPQLKVVRRHYNLPEVGTPYFAIGRNNFNLILKRDVKKIDNGINYSPYVPEK